jgi:hypothetical protein
MLDAAFAMADLDLISRIHLALRVFMLPEQFKCFAFRTGLLGVFGHLVGGGYKQQA